MQGFVPAFITLFVIANVIPTLPTIIDQTAHLPRKHGRGVQLEALAGANVLLLGFAFFGPRVFEFLGVGLSDLRVAGGLVLLVFAVHDLLFSRAERKQKQADWVSEDDVPGIVPLGVPIMVGPATMATAIVVFQTYGELVGLAAVVANLVVNVALIVLGRRVTEMLGDAYTRAVAKVMSLVLATLAVAMIRIGIEGMLAGG